MRQPPGGDPSDDDDDTLMMGWAPGKMQELPRFDISATNLRRMSPSTNGPRTAAELPDLYGDGPEIEVSEVDDEPTRVHKPDPLPPVAAPPVRPGSRVESDSSQFAVSAHAFAVAQHRQWRAGSADALPAAAVVPPPLPPPPPDLAVT